MQHSSIRSRVATLAGVRGHPHAELDFAWDAEVVDQVKALPGSRWDGERRVWMVDDFGGDPVKVCRELGFELVDRSGQLVEHLDVRPIARPCPEDPTMWEIYLRWGAYARKLHSWLDASDMHNSDRGCWMVPPKRLRNAPWVYLAEELPAPDSEVSAPPLPYDHSIDGLRGVPVTALKTVHRTAAEKLAAVQIETVHDLLHQIPRRYIDLTDPHSLADADAASDAVAIVGNVTRITPASGPGGIVKVGVRDDNGAYLHCRWFNAPYIARRVKTGQRVVVRGRVETFSIRNETAHGMSNPLIEPIDADAPGKIIGFYPASAKNDVSTWMIHRAAAEAADRLGWLVDPVPPDLVDARFLPTRADAYAQVHNPKSLAEAAAGRDRLVYDELLRMQVVLAMQREASKSGKGIAHDTGHDLARSYLERLPFGPTAAQKRCLREISADMASEVPMSRLVQGDVGSGKTMLAVLSMLDAVQCGRQAAMAAPTEILAFQHWAGIVNDLADVRLADGTSVRVELLTNKVTGKRRKQVLAGLADGSIHIVIGTHALFADNVVFADLSLVVVDEQHRFGVDQRRAMLGKRSDGRVPDVLQMTATPIPRTAMMTVFGDLDVSTIDEMPPGRVPTKTVWMQIAHPTDVASPVWADVREQVAAGRQAFVVTPLITESLTREAASCIETAEALSTGALAGLRIATVTGKDAPDSRAATMAAFSAGDIDVLVATTVIEVGVNVPNATVMVVLGADGFGLAQLHQLRGRVGRGEWPGTCWLAATPRTTSGEERMKAMVETTDGFVLAETDLRIRGAGQMTTAIQSGTGADLKVASILEDTELLEWAKADAGAIVAADPQLDAHPMLRAEIDRFLPEDAKRWLVAS